VPVIAQACQYHTVPAAVSQIPSNTTNAAGTRMSMTRLSLAMSRASAMVDPHAGAYNPVAKPGSILLDDSATAGVRDRRSAVGSMPSGIRRPGLEPSA